MEKVELTYDQIEAKNKIVHWFNNYKEQRKQLFILSGYAGTGKTFLINHLVNDVLGVKKNRVAFCTPTGKASSVLIAKGQESVTVHHLIYIPIIDVHEEDVEEIDKNGEVNTVKKKKKKLSFAKRDKIDEYDLIVLDEVSMVDDEMLKDLASYNVPILATGDNGQLPPVQRVNSYIETPDASLTEIVRQAEDNTIVKIATKAREGQYIEYGDYGDVLVVKNSELDDQTYQDFLLNVDQIICGTNNTRHMLNDQVRSMKGIDISKDKLPKVGEKIILTENNWGLSLYENSDFNYVNGVDAIVESIEILDDKKRLGNMSIKTSFTDEVSNEFYFDTGNFVDAFISPKDGKYYSFYHHESKTEAASKSDGKYRIIKPIPGPKKSETMSEYRERIKKEIKDRRKTKHSEIINRLEFGYVISAHKSQGSEYDTVVVFDESNVFRQDKNKWLYTAITRAKKKLIIIRDE